MVNPYPISPWRHRDSAWLRLAPMSPLRQLSPSRKGSRVGRAAVRCQSCGGAVCVHNGELRCSMCGRSA